MDEGTSTAKEGNAETVLDIQNQGHYLAHNSIRNGSFVDGNPVSGLKADGVLVS